MVLQESICISGLVSSRHSPSSTTSPWRTSLQTILTILVPVPQEAEQRDKGTFSQIYRDPEQFPSPPHTPHLGIDTDISGTREPSPRCIVTSVLLENSPKSRHNGSTLDVEYLLVPCHCQTKVKINIKCFFL